MIALGLAGIAKAQYQLLPDKRPQQLFSGVGLEVAVTWSNVVGKTLDCELHTRILQTTSETAVQWAEKPWKRLQLLPGQTVVESAQMSFPAVNAETKFLIQWLDESNHVLGKTDVLVYPVDSLKPVNKPN